MTHLSDLFDDDLLMQMFEQKYVRSQVHPSLPLEILNYTEKAQYEQEWNDVTLNCRGLIWNYETGEVIARGFKKFFNWDDSSQPYPPTGPVIRMPKMDGSLGILYLNDHWVEVATRGSFASDQALWASQRILKMHQNGEVDWDDLVMDKYSYLVEIIYPENRIVVDYGEEKRLVLLDVLDTATGKSDLGEFDRVFWVDKVEKKPLPGFKDTMGGEIPDGEEGFVFYWPEKDFRVKMKAAAYLELHRIIFGLNARMVWERLGNGETAQEICEKLPDEFHGWVKDIAAGLIKEQERIRHEAFTTYDRVKKTLAVRGYDAQLARKQFAQEVASLPNKSYLFLLLDGKSIDDKIWQEIKPAGGITIKTISEDVA